jgi:hypothetical protein
MRHFAKGLNWKISVKKPALVPNLKPLDAGRILHPVPPHGQGKPVCPDVFCLLLLTGRARTVAPVAGRL